MTKKQIDCADIAHNCSLFFLKYMSVNEIDSAKHLLNYWESKCGMREPIFRAKILLALQTGELNDALWTETPLNQIFNYQSRRDIVTSVRYFMYDNYKSFYGYIPPGEEFDNFTLQWALELKTYFNSESIEFIMAEFYSDDYEAILSKIQSKTLEDCLLSKKYYEVVHEYRILPEFHLSFLAGMWIPTGALTMIGVHPDLGIQMGWKKKRINYDFTLSIKFANAPKVYNARRDTKSDEWESTDHFFGGYIGFEVGGDILSRKRNEIQAIGGIGYDGFDVLKENKEENLKASSTSSFNINFGLAYRFYVKNNLYLGLRVKYNIVDYTLNKVIDFSGNPITVHFSIGMLKNATKDANLKALGYSLRKKNKI
jgi:hypothetical protein